MEVEKEIAVDSMDEGVAYGADNKNCETNKINCEESSEDNCELDEGNVEKQLDVAGLARAYKQMNSTDNEGFYKDVLCIAIGSLCGKYLYRNFFFLFLF